MPFQGYWRCFIILDSIHCIVVSCLNLLFSPVKLPFPSWFTSLTLSYIMLIVTPKKNRKNSNTTTLKLQN